MVDVSSQNSSVSINVSSSGNSASIKASPDTAQYYSEKSREYAISDKLIDGKDYSSKYYANKSAISESNAKDYAQSSQDTYNQFQQSVDGALSNVDIAVQGAVESINTKSVEAIDNCSLPDLPGRDVYPGFALHAGHGDPDHRRLYLLHQRSPGSAFQIPVPGNGADQRGCRGGILHRGHSCKDVPGCGCLITKKNGSDEPFFSYLLIIPPEGH